MQFKLGGHEKAIKAKHMQVADMLRIEGRRMHKKKHPEHHEVDEAEQAVKSYKKWAESSDEEKYGKDF